MALASRAATLALLLVALGCGSSGDDVDPRRVPEPRELTGTYDTRIELDGVELATTAGRVHGGSFDEGAGVTIDFPIAALETIHLQGRLAADGTLDLVGGEQHPARSLSVTASMRASTDGRFVRLDGVIGTIAGFLTVGMSRPTTPPPNPPTGAFVLTFEPSVSDAGPSSRVAATIEATECCCSVQGGPEMPDRVGGVLFGGTCAVAPSGAFWFSTRFRTDVPDTSPLGESFLLVGTLRTTATGIVGGGSFGLERFPPNADVFGGWRARGD